MHIPKLTLISDLKKIGVREGDILVIACALSEVGYLKNGFETLIEVLLDIVGASGAIIGLSFTYGDENNSRIYRTNMPPDTGGLNRALVDHPKSIRSSHPMNSFIGIGESIKDILSSHTPNSPCYEPIHKLAKNNKGKMLKIGTIWRSPGITTVHVAQNLLGFKEATSGKYGIKYYDDDDIIQTYVRHDAGGCSMGFHNFYSEYEKDFEFTINKVGNADSVLVNLHNALKTDLRILKEEPQFFFCGRNECYKCNTSHWDFSALKEL